MQMKTLQPLSGKKIILGVTGSVAATKSAQLAKILREKGAQVLPILTSSAREILSPQGVKALEHACASNKAATELFDAKTRRAAREGKLRDYTSPHLAKAMDADLLLIAPATANTLNKMACGITEGDEEGKADLLSSIYLARPKNALAAVAPAMHSQMWAHPATRKSVELLKSRGVFFIGPEKGRLASGDEGNGRMASPEEIAEEVEKILETPMNGLRVLVTAGPTKEYIDAVRFISNDSSGTMGCALARGALIQGAKTTIVLGPSNPDAEELLPKGVRVIRITSAKQLSDAAVREFPKSDISFFAAAVSDFAPEKKSGGKLKKGGKKEILLKLAQTPDALKECGEKKNGRQVIVGFALETESVIANARKKLLQKNADIIVANSPESMGGEKTRATLVWRERSEKLGLQSKKMAAAKIIGRALEMFEEKNR